MSRSTASKPYHHGNLRSALLDAAADVARASGPDAVTLREVARRAGVSHTAAYNHFADKKDLLRGLAVRAFSVLGDRLDEVADGPEPTVERLALAYLAFAREFPAEFRFMFDRDLCMPTGIPDPIEEASARSRAALDRVLRASTARADDDEQLVTERALAAWALVHGVTTLVQETPSFKDLPAAAHDGLMTAAVAQLVHGIAGA